jgi:translation initiation factor IF-2
MSEDNGDTKGGGRTITLRGAGETTRVRQSFSHGRTKSVVVEKVRKRVVVPTPGAAIPPAPVAPPRPVEPKSTPVAPPRPADPKSAAAVAAPKPAPVKPVVRPIAPAAEAPVAPAAEAPKATVAEAPSVAAPAVEPEKPAPAPAPQAEAPAPVPTPVAVEAPQPPATPAAAEAPRPAAPVAETGPAPAPIPVAATRAPAAPPAPRAPEPARPQAPQAAARPAQPAVAPTARAPQPAQPGRPAPQQAARGPAGARPAGRGAVHKALSPEEHARRLKALEAAQRNEEARKKAEAEDSKRREAEAERRKKEIEEIARREAEEQVRREREEAAKAEAERQKSVVAARQDADDAARRARPAPVAVVRPDAIPEDDGRPARRGAGRAPVAEAPKRPSTPRAKDGGDRRRSGKLTIEQVTGDAEGGRARSLAAMRRRQEREKRKMGGAGERERVVRDVRIPDAITVQELANRMAERGADVVKTLMKMGVMATINQTLDADTAQLVVEEFGHKFIRVSEADVEDVIDTGDDANETLRSRAPVVTIMGHVDHGKTSLLDALRKTNVVAGEAGGITQHIGAYQVTTPSGSKVTFLDTPGHAAFTSMRARGAKVTDIVILVVAADDSVMPQTVEAISHAKAAGVPMIVAINKCDKPSANPDKVRQNLLQHEVFVEALGGDVLDVEVSALTGKGLDALVENIALQAEILDLKANPDRPAEGAVIEAKLDVGRGPVATVLVQRGTLKPGDIFVVGEQWGKVRALMDDKGERVKEAGPSFPVEVLGLSGTPEAGDVLNVVESEAKAREIADYRQRLARDKQAAVGARATLDQLLAQAKTDANVKELPLVVKADVQGSAEAIVQALEKIGNEEVRVRILHSGVGAITESDVQLADASNAPIIGFNVRANAPAREAANQKGVEIRYYSIIYNLVDDVKAAASGLLSAEIKETFIGYAKILQVFKVSNVGKVAGCMVTEGVARRHAGVRLLRDNVVIHEGKLKTLKRFKDEVKEVQVSQECGMAFENYEDIREGDVIEIFTTEEIERSL